MLSVMWELTFVYNYKELSLHSVKEGFNVTEYKFGCCANMGT